MVLVIALDGMEEIGMTNMAVAGALILYERLTGTL
jgi:hypothetical protein